MMKWLTSWFRSYDALQADSARAAAAQRDIADMLEQVRDGLRGYLGAPEPAHLPAPEAPAETHRNGRGQKARA